MSDLDRVFIKEGVPKEALDSPVDDRLLDLISKETGLEAQWECLATGIGVAGEICHDIQQIEPQNKCKAMLKRWKQLYGSEATYRRLIGGFEYQIVGRRDLTEKVCKYILNAMKKSTVSYKQTLRCPLLCLVALASIIGLILILGAAGQVIFTLIDDTYHREEYRVTNYSLLPDVYLDTETVGDCKDIQLLKQHSYEENNSSPCETVGSDLPNIHSNLFIGRDKDVSMIVRKIHSASIVNVNGAPGFGKSTVVIHVGYELVSNGTSVRYVDVEQSLGFFAYEPHTADNKTRYHRKSFDKESTEIFKTVTSLGESYDVRQGDTGTRRSSNYIEELVVWSNNVQCFTVIILDNCDDLVSSSRKHLFVELISLLVKQSDNLVHVIVVTQARMLLLDHFDRWTVKELSTKDSVKLLQKLAPGINVSHAETVSNFVERCPLALKVVGNILHLYGGDTLTEKLEEDLKHNPIGVLDRADQRDHQFRFIMELALSRISDLVTIDQCYSISLFPGTFSSEAGLSILPRAKLCLDTYVKFSLLDEYFHHEYVQRYRMHRLIREFLLEKVTSEDRRFFRKRFSDYFENYLAQYVTGGLRQLNEIDEYRLSLETQNIHHYLNLLISQEAGVHLTPRQLATLSYGVSEELISFSSIKPHFKTFMENLTNVCSFVDSDPVLCGRLYSEIIEHFYIDCLCTNLSQYLKHLINHQCPCTSPERVFNCPSAYDIKNTESIWVHLSTQTQSFIERIIMYNCYHDHVFTFNFFLYQALLILSTNLNGFQKCYCFPVSIIISILHSTYLIRNQKQIVVVVLELFLKAMCYKLLFLLFLSLSLLLIHSVRQVLFVIGALNVFYFVMLFLWRDSTYPLQGCDFLPLCL